LSRHPNIVQYNEVGMFRRQLFIYTSNRLYVVTKAYATATEVCIVMELVDGGCLTDIIMDQEPFPERMIAFVCQQSLQGLAFLHKDFRLHRDIKSGISGVNEYIAALFILFIS